MKKGLLFLFTFIFAGSLAFGQTRILKVTYDATSGTAGLVGSTSCYLHSGMGDGTNAWTYVAGNWGMDDGIGKMTASMNTDEWTLVSDIDALWGTNGMMPAAYVPTDMGMVFRSSDGSLEGKGTSGTDIFGRSMDTNTPMVEADGAAFAGVTLEWLTANGVEEVLSQIGVANYTAYPNPAVGDRITISFEVLNTPKEVHISILNTMGQRVAKLAQGMQPVGQNEVSWNLDQVAPGVYFYRIDAAGLVAVRKLIVE